MNAPLHILHVFWFVWGSCVGSFLNVCIWRMPREQSIVAPRSRCPGCGHAIAWYDNIPLVSFLALRGACRHCRGRINWRYPLVELLTAVATVVTLSRFGAGPVGLIYLVFIYGLLTASFIDIDFRIIPDEISLGGLVLGVIVSVLVPSLHDTTSRWVSLQRSVVGLLVGGGWLYATGALGDGMLRGLRHLGILLRRNRFWRMKLARYRHMRESMGGGDVKLLAMAGSILGWKLVTMTFFLAPILAVIPGLVMVLLNRSHYIPYGPYLSLALMVLLFFGQELLAVSGIEGTLRLFWQYYGWSG